MATINLCKHIIEPPIDLLDGLERCVHAVFRRLHRVGKLTAYSVLAKCTQALFILPDLLYLLQDADAIARDMIRCLEAMVAAIYNIRPIFDKMVGEHLL